MIDIKIHEDTVSTVNEFLVSNEQFGDDWREEKTGLNDLLAEVKRLREENETLRKMDWEYECLWTWLAENTNLLNTIEPLMEEWKKEMKE